MTRTPRDPHPAPATTRTFIAIEMPAEAKELIAAYVGRLKCLVSKGIKWVDPRTAHLTLAFLGNVPDTRLPTLPQIVDSVAAASPPIHLKTGPLGAFPNPRRPRVLWLGLDGDTQLLSRMQGHLQDALEADGFPRERRAFNSHVTLGRARGKGAIPIPEAVLNRLAEDTLALEVREIVLMSSVLTARGPIHTPIHRAPLSLASHIP